MGCLTGLLMFVCSQKNVLISEEVGNASHKFFKTEMWFRKKMPVANAMMVTASTIILLRDMLSL